ncbi:MAG TPA: translocation/assembly module TamB domain-containing protein [Gemmatimonadales bacterium]|jgi:translocation and assembly module TamB
MRTVRRVAAVLLVPLMILVTTMIGLTAAIVLTPPGRAMLARVASAFISGSAAGTIQIGSIGGNLWDHVVLGDVVIRDQRGGLLLRTPRLEASYLIPGLLAHRLVFSHVRVDSLDLHLVREPSDRWNYEEIFHIGEGPPSTTPPPHVALDGLQVTNATLQINVPTTSRGVRTAVSRHGRVPTQPEVDSSSGRLMRVYRATDLNVAMRLLRISTPRRDPLLANITALRTHFNDPAVTITNLTGTIIAAGDSLHFDLDSAALPSTRLRGGGAVRWPRDTVLFDFALDVPQVALRDLWWVQPDFPDWTGRGHLIAKSVNGTRTDYRLDNLSLASGSSSLAGRATIAVDARRGLGLDGLDLQLRNTPVDLLRPYLDTLPVSGALTGHLATDGFLDSLRLNGDLVFADATVNGTPTSHLALGGVIHLGGADGAVFQNLALRESSIALPTIRRLVPSVALPGRLGLNGTLNGPWQNMTFVGTAEHVAPDSAVSRLLGMVRLDTRDSVLGLGLDADFDRLSFDALRSGYPDLPSRGGLTGHVQAEGTLAALTLNAHLTGEIGTVDATGVVSLDSPHFGADSLVLLLRRVDVEAITNGGTSTALNGRIMVRGSIDSGVPPRGTLSINLDQSRFGGATVDVVTGLVHADHGMLTVDTGTVIWNDGRVDARGTLGWSAPDSGQLVVHAEVSSLTPFDSLLRAATGMARDSVHPQPFEGSAIATLLVSGARNSANISGTASGTDLVIDDWHAGSVVARIRADSFGYRGIDIEAAADSIGNGLHIADLLKAHLSGRQDSLHVAGSVAMVGLTASGGGTWQHSVSSSLVHVDSLSLAFPHQRFALAQPVRVALSAGTLSLGDTLHLQSVDGSGDVRVSGAMPGDQPGKLDVAINGLELVDVFGVLQRDTTALNGIGSLDLHLAGTRDAPTFNGTAAVLSPVVGDLHAPTVHATFDYHALRLKSNVTLWSTGQQVFNADVSLPLDLALTQRDVRKLDGPLDISGHTDSVDMVILGTLSSAVLNPTGTLSIDLTGHGTWNAPQLQGSVTIRNGGMYLPSLGVSYRPINGTARFAGDSLVVDSMQIANGPGRLLVNGAIRFPRLAQPSLNLSLTARAFKAIDSPGFLTLQATGNVKLKGPLWQPVLTSDGTVALNESVLYFADLLSKSVIDLEDPENAALIDTAAIRREGIGNQFSNRFLDSLTIDGLRLRIGNDVWLRSQEANIQLEGQLTVNKTRKVYSLSGNLDAPRGTYSLTVGPIIRPFTVDQGTVNYFGTPDLNAALDIKAHYDVHTLDGDNFSVVAAITGSVREPKVQLSSPGRALSERDLTSYVLFGRSDFQVTGSQHGGTSDVVGAAVGIIAGQVASGLQNRLAGSSIGLSSITIRPGSTIGGTSAGSSATQLAAGLTLGRRAFVTFDAGVCFSGQNSGFQKRNFGASIDYRLSREFRIQLAAEPVQSCVTNTAADVFTTLNRYQLGGDLLWQRDY